MTQENRFRSVPDSQGAGDDFQPSAAAYKALLNQYGEAMIRVGQLELQVDQLTRQLRAVGQPSMSQAAAPAQESTEIKALNNKIEALEGLITSMPQKTSPAPRPTTPGESEDIRQMRIQMNNLANQLLQTEQQLSAVQGTSHTRHNRRRGEHNRPLWQKVARKVGLRKSKSRRTKGGDSKPIEGSSQ